MTGISKTYMPKKAGRKVIKKAFVKGHNQMSKADMAAKKVKGVQMTKNAL